MKRATPWLFLSPGLFCFGVFLVLPMILTVAISFRMLKTGHWFSENQVRAMLLEEPSGSGDPAEFPFQLLCTGPDQCGIQTRLGGSLLFGPLTKPGTTVLLGSDAPEGAAPAAKMRAQQILRGFETTLILAPDGREFRIFRSDLLKEWMPRFVPEGDGLREVDSGHLFTPDQDAGAFRSGRLLLAPGFSTWAGLANYKRLFLNQGEAGVMARVLAWTLVWALGSVAFCFILGCGLALVMQRESNPWRFIFRILLIIPYAIPFFISVLVFRGLMNQDFGLFNEVLGWLGWTPIGWLEQPTWAKFSCLLVNTWLGYPYMFLVITGVLQSIPRSHYEASMLEGASRWTTFAQITWPQLIRAMGPLLVGSFAFNMNNFVGIYLLTGGGPPEPGSASLAGATDILISYTYRLAFEGSGEQNFGLASAISVLLFGLVLVISIAQIYGFQWWTKREGRA